MFPQCMACQASELADLRWCRGGMKAAAREVGPLGMWEIGSSASGAPTRSLKNKVDCWAALLISTRRRCCTTSTLEAMQIIKTLDSVEPLEDVHAPDSARTYLTRQAAGGAHDIDGKVRYRGVRALTGLPSR